MHFNTANLLFVQILCSIPYHQTVIEDLSVINLQCPTPDLQFSPDFNICYLYTEPSDYSTSCPHLDSLQFAHYKDKLPDKSIPIWAPVTRPQLTVFKWIDLDTSYKTPFGNNYQIQNPIGGKFCLTYNAESFENVATNCKEKYSKFCAYQYFPNTKIFYQSSSASLILEAFDTILSLTITNPSALYHYEDHTFFYCFTDASALEDVYRYPHLEQKSATTDKEVYELPLFPKSPGNYWCEAFSHEDLTMVKSNNYFYETAKIQFEFVAIIEKQYVNGTDPINDRFIESVQLISFYKLNETTSYMPRFMKFVSLDETNLKVVINIHLTPKVQFNQTIHEEWVQLKDDLLGIFQSLQHFGAKLIDLLHNSKCMENTFNNLTWPETELNSRNFSKELCVRQGQLVQRNCGGSFIDGAKWEDNVEDCEYRGDGATSPTTEQLHIILYSSDAGEVKLRKVSALFVQTDEKVALDVYLTGLILKSIEKEENLQFSDFSSLMNSLLALNSEILKEAQGRISAGDVILNAASTIIAHNVFDKHWSIETSSDHFFHLQALYQLNTSSVYQCLMTICDAEIAIRTNLARENLVEVFVATSAFLRSDLFAQVQANFSVIGPIFMVQHNLTDSKIQISYKTSKHGTNDYKCNILELSQNTSFWKENGTLSIESDSLVICEYATAGIFALSQKDDEDDDDTNSTTPHITQDLDDLINSNDTEPEIIEKLLNISTRYDEYDEYAIYLTGKILERVSNFSDNNLMSVAEIVSNLHEIDRDILIQSQLTNKSTDLILYNVDEIFKQHVYEEQIEIVTTNFMLLISSLRDIQGVILHQTENITYTILDYLKDPYEAIQSCDDVETAVIFSEDLAKQFVDDSKVIISYHTKEVLFNEKRADSRKVSKVFGIILPEIESYNGPLLVYHNLSSTWSDKCAHWYYDHGAMQAGQWRNDKPSTRFNQLFQCAYNHTTHFALLLLPGDSRNLPYIDLITSINCVLSAFGLCAIIFTAIVFKRWRLNTGNQILLNFAFAISIQIASFYTSSLIHDKVNDAILCTIIGVVLHYSLISQFCWMFIIAILQFKRFVEVLGGPPKHVLVKACLCGWILPLLPVGCVFILDQDNYTSGKAGLCYPSGLGLYLGVWLPLTIIIAINTVIFVYILYNVVHKKTECVKKDSTDILVEWRLAILLFFMLGLTWVFGFLGQMEYGDFFVYVFCCSATLQGFVMFLFFIVFNKNTRMMYLHGVKMCCRNKW